MKSSSNNRAGARGVTLLEMLVVLAIVSLSIVLFSPMTIGAARKNDALRSAELMTASLRGARADALAGSRPVDVVFDVANGAYIIDGGPAYRLGSAISMEFTGALELMRPSGEGVLRLHPDGSSSGAVIRLISEREVDEISVDWLTGSVRFSRARSP